MALTIVRVRIGEARPAVVDVEASTRVVEELEAEEDEDGQAVNKLTGARGHRRSVQIVDPVPEDFSEQDIAPGDDHGSGLTK